MKLLTLLLGIFIFCDPALLAGPSDPIADTPVGRFRGSRMTSTAGREFLAFRGIRYAKPPVGPLRFKDPVAIEPVTGIVDATKEGSICIQNNIMLNSVQGAEDCLVLNIYAHSTNPGGAAEKGNLKPVMFFIHGGGWFMGSSSGVDYHGPHHFMDQDIVLVTINYRLGPFGFLSTEDEVAPGNYGLLDQNMALKWVRDNIQFFGGDPNKVTIFGQSVGAASVHYHMLSQRSTGLFHRAIMQSGTGLCPWAAPEDQGQPTRTLASKLKCPTSPSLDLVNCLRSKSAQEIISNVINLNEMSAPIRRFGPRVDVERRQPFLSGRPLDLIQKGIINQVPLIIGVNQNESALFLAFFLNERGELKSECKENLEKCMTSLFPGKMNETFARRALDFYLDRKKPINEQITKLEQMLSDGLFLKCIDDTVLLHSRFSSQPIFYYMYAHRGQQSVTDVLNVRAIDLGVCHGDEILRMFSNQMYPPSKSIIDDQIGKTLVQLWSSFADTGKPKSELMSPEWPPVDSRRQRFLKIAVNPMLVDPNSAFRDRIRFWN